MNLQPDQFKIRDLVTRYVQVNNLRSAVEIILTISLLIINIAVLYVAIKFNIWLLIPLVFTCALLFTRVFILQHDLGHRTLFKSKKCNDILGSILGVFVLTPYFLWRRAHVIHHANGGNASRRPWFGDIDMQTVEEYKAQSPRQQFWYRLYRNPLIMFFLGGFYLFVVEHRFFKHTYRKHAAFGKIEARSIVWTNVAIIVLYGALIVLFGFKFYFLGILLPQWLGGAAGIYLFYVQHNFKGKYYAADHEWNLYDSALKGSSFYELPQPLRWFTANIGYHHVHTLIPSIPFYKLRQCHEENAIFHQAPRFGLKHMRQLVSLKLYDEKNSQMITWQEYTQSN